MAYNRRLFRRKSRRERAAIFRHQWRTALVVSAILLLLYALYQRQRLMVWLDSLLS